jgi:16S rRNA (cytosine1402-N4)-methyltransferase
MAACRMSETFHQHIPVLLDVAVARLFTSFEGIYVDATFGRGGHAQAILNRLGKHGKLIAFDKDPEAVAYAKKHFSHDNRFTIFHSSFAHMQTYLDKLHLLGKVNGILFDLGVSSPQFDNRERGFSFAQESNLDMRMNTNQEMDAKSWLAEVKESELADVLWNYGEEKYARRIARAIVDARRQSPITTTTQLANIIMRAIPKQKKSYEKHPATKSFQAIRILINQELIEIEQGLIQSLEALTVGGRLLAISFHSLEDRIVKQFIKQHEKGQALPRHLPIKDNVFNARMKAIGKPIKPSLQEININPRARSAILRIAEKLS